MICPYSLRATSQATVSMPLHWSEVKKGLKPEEITLFTVAKFESNPWKGMLEDKQKLEKSVD
jgi:bifunctional non-homologous end joining protein LigD